MQEKGFSVVEVVMVIVILGITGMIAIPRLMNLAATARSSSARGIGSAIAGTSNMLHIQYVTKGTPYILGTTGGPSTGVIFNANIAGATVIAAPTNVTVNGASARITMTIGGTRFTMTYTGGSPTRGPRVKFNNF